MCLYLEQYMLISGLYQRLGLILEHLSVTIYVISSSSYKATDFLVHESRCNTYKLLTQKSTECQPVLLCDNSITGCHSTGCHTIPTCLVSIVTFLTNMLLNINKVNCTFFIVLMKMFQRSNFNDL